ncbi:hypothetical protein PMIN06_001521 [Paraphaeosphaeria minitans]
MMMASRTSGSFRAAAIWLLATVANAGPAVKVLNGSYEGIHLPQLGQDIFLEIPYAQDTGGENRFRVPQAFNEAWNGTRFAQAYSNACHDFQPDADAAYGMGEDCLSISIVRPIGIPENKTLPVAVWIHGDSYQVGTSGRPNYNLTWLVQRPVAIGKHIVATSINYRKGGWGMLYSREIQGSDETNPSHRDMRKALAWISENMASAVTRTVLPSGENRRGCSLWFNS